MCLFILIIVHIEDFLYLFDPFRFLTVKMSRTQQKLQAMSAQELLIQEKKRMIEEKIRLDNAKKSHTDCKLFIYLSQKTKLYDTFFSSY